MMRKFFTISLALFSVVLLTAAWHGGTILIDDFNDGDAAGWDLNDFTGVGVNYVNPAGEYVLESTVPIPVDDPSVGTVESHWEAAEGRPRFANGTLQGIIRANADGTTVGFTVRDNDDAETGYDFVGSTSLGTFYIDRYDLGADPNAPQTILAVADSARFPFVAGESWNLEARYVGHQLQMKVWRVGDCKPSSPTLSVIDEGLQPVSGTGFSMVVYFDPFALNPDQTEVQVSGAFDNITFTPDARR